MVVKTGLSCTSLVCCITRSNEVLVALADYSLKCVDVGKGVMDTPNLEFSAGSEVGIRRLKYVPPP